MAGLKYEYQTLEKGKIRCLHVVGRRDDGNIVIRLEDVVLEEADNTYTAISYTWGSANIVHRVCIGDRYLTVQDNAWQFLKHCWQVRSSIPDSVHHLNHAITERLWVDSICINQNDNVEKSTQVALMGEIYSKASHVFVWLDKVSEHSCLGYEATHSTGRLHASALPLTTALEETTSSCHAQKGGLRRAILCEADRIMRHPYWGRLWVVQEVRLARRRRLVLGSYCFKLSQIGALQHYIDAIRETDVAGQHPLPWFLQPSANSQDTSRGFWPSRIEELYYTSFSKLTSLEISLPQPMIRVAEYFDEQSCQDKRDILYGLVAMTPWAGQITIDYTLRPEEVFLQALLLLQKENTIRPWREADKFQRNCAPMPSVLSFKREMGITIDSVIKCTKNIPTERAATIEARSLTIKLKLHRSARHLEKIEGPGKQAEPAIGASSSSSIGKCARRELPSPWQEFAFMLNGRTTLHVACHEFGTTFFNYFISEDENGQCWITKLDRSIADKLDIKLNRTNHLVDDVKEWGLEALGIDPDEFDASWSWSEELTISCSLLELVWMLDVPQRVPGHELDAPSSFSWWHLRLPLGPLHARGPGQTCLFIEEQQGRTCLYLEEKHNDLVGVFDPNFPSRLPPLRPKHPSEVFRKRDYK